jgi:hypothetical protein
MGISPPKHAKCEEDHPAGCGGFAKGLASSIRLIACALGCEGIVSKRLGSRYRPGPTKCPDWVKVKNPAAPAVRREAEEDWGKR